MYAIQLRIPRVVGMLGTGLLLANVPGGVIAAFPAKWGVQMRAAALATIFLRCGLELEFKVGYMIQLLLILWPAISCLLDVMNMLMCELNAAQPSWHITCFAKSTTEQPPGEEWLLPAAAAAVPACM